MKITIEFDDGVLCVTSEDDNKSADAFWDALTDDEKTMLTQIMIHCVEEIA